jgi:probable addiction module antidote protein
MKKKLRNYQEKLLEDLKDTELATEYLNVALLDNDPQIFLLALKNVHAAQGGEITELAKKAQISRENLYRIFSKNGNPKLKNIVAILNAVGLSLAVQPLHMSK